MQEKKRVQNFQELLLNLSITLSYMTTLKSQYNHTLIFVLTWKKRKIIEANDLLIASHPLSLEAILVTNNIREFEHVEQLVLENWSV